MICLSGWLLWSTPCRWVRQLSGPAERVGVVQVRNLDARTEEEVARADLVKHFSEPQLNRKRTFQYKHAT